MDNKELEEYLIEINKTPLLSIEEEIELSKAVQQKGADCDEMKKLVKCNERFVMSVARQYQNRGLSIEELQVVVLVLLLLPCGGFAERFLLPLGVLMSMSPIPFKTQQFFKSSVIMEVRVLPLNLVRCMIKVTRRTESSDIH